MTQDKQAYGVHWFRRDLRVSGNPGLLAQFARHQGRVVGIFCFDTKFLSRPDFSHNRFQFFLHTLKALRDELRQMGSDLLVIDGAPTVIVPQLLHELNLGPLGRPSLFTYCRDYEPFARERDSSVAKAVEALGCRVESFRDHLVIEPFELQKEGPGSFYQVYSPFARRWLETLRSPEVQKRLRKPRENFARIFSLKWEQVFAKGASPRDSLEDFTLRNASHVTVPIPETGERVAQAAIKEFAERLNNYSEHRDFPALHGTSKFSLFFKNGSLTTTQVIAALKLSEHQFKSSEGGAKFLKELIWREFYYHILWHRPDVEQNAFLPAFKSLPWSNREDWFAKWCAGETGYPIVDAGMRQLMTTGWMHNRVRMIVASFLTKDLLIDWRWGERHFMRYLLDGDLAPNNGGWQWAASTGCDPQPYFRIFNPVLQSQKFDPEGEYIRRFVPELGGLSAKQIHDPRLHPEGLKYPKPIVDHFVQKELALSLFKHATVKTGKVPTTT